jgi:hypothetical protein
LHFNLGIEAVLMRTSKVEKLHEQLNREVFAPVDHNGPV